MNVVDHKCLSCGSPLNFDITSQKWICHYCKTIYSLQDLSSNIEKYDRTQISKFDVYECNNCGAKVLGDDLESAKMGTIYIFFAGALLETLFINHINTKY